MLNALKLALAAGLIVGGANAAMAQQTAPRTAAHQGTPHRANTIPYSYQEYGLENACSNRPFAPGCDKRGVW
jgi:hypothetical protein